MMRHKIRRFVLAVSAVVLGGLALTACDRQATPPPAAKAMVPAAVSPAERPPARPTSKPVAVVRRVVLISVDGLRPDLIYRAGAINVMDLIATGAYTLWAQTSDVVMTLPSHTSMLTGVTPARHGIDFNEFRLDVYPRYPTIFEAAHAHGLSTAVVAGKAKFRLLCRPGSVDWQQADEYTDEEVASLAVKTLRDQRPDLMFVHFSGCDYAGHFTEWGSPRQLEAIREIDLGVGRIMAAVDELKVADETVILLTADHGGAGNTHWDDPRGKTIPWMARGPGLRRGFDMDRLGGPVVRTEDTFATVSLLLGVPMHPDIDGKPVTAIVEQPAEELLR